MRIEQVLAELKRLDADSQHLRNQRVEIDNKLAKNDERTSRLRIYVDIDQEEAEPGSKQQTDGPASTTASTSDTSNGRSKTRRAMDMVVDLIRTAGRPVSTKDLLAQMKQQGMVLGGQNPAATLSNLLSRDQKRVVTTSKLGWKLVEWGDDPQPSDRPKRQRRPRNSQRTKKAAQNQQDGTAPERSPQSAPAYRI